MRIGRFSFLVCVVVGGASCDSTDTDPPPEDPVLVTPAEFGAPYDNLSDWHLFADALGQTPADDLVAYDVIAPLFSDYALKWRFVYVPKDQKIGYVGDDIWDFPVGTVLVKTFAYADDLAAPEGARRLLETRLLWHEPEGWTAHTYVWNEEQTEAVREVGGKFIGIDFVDANGQTVHNEYRVPNTNECADCHHVDDDAGEAIVGPLGPKTRQLDRDYDHGDAPKNQLEYFASLGLLDTDPPAASERERLVDPSDESADVSLRARSYFDANCSSCHRQGGSATQSDLELDFHATDPSSDPATWGVCKIPTSAGGATCGNTYDVVPGDPDSSVMVCRMGSTEIDQRMPPLGSKIVHAEGLALVREWISSLEPAGCN
ncbi:MAG: hypothetical protein HOW73_19885 [Polyangiaceae bacterium]|nr:hypothetical protein [Polyangiaceae bacterium]